MHLRSCTPLALALVAAAFAGHAAWAQTAPPAGAGPRPPRTVAALAEVCATPSSSPDHIAASYFCRGFLAGVGQYHAALHPAGGMRPPVFCVPEPPPRLVDAAAAFAAWAQANPQFGGEMAVDGLMRFARQAYPCPAGASGTTGGRGR
ncbi:hypothetical protein JMJ55_27915 [Belnapia sp. T6]|uniref:Rap1a immunity protein domain-containing protein n=1 Tax=Belnapia mucosa TaxID=2804532 RepID=A0ABS1VBY1_9PROT|nr:Rap1a/Tai family immunity protein [Belnapia mucosa]MBL6459153.1 hypothetical protein [Belnapia mucosa]